MINKIIKITLILFVALNVNAQIQIEQLDYPSLKDSIFQSIDKSIDSLNVQIGTTGTDINAPSIAANRTITVNVPTASATVRGALSSSDWNTFNSKFTLPTFTAGSVLFSNGSTIAQNNARLFFDNTNFRLGIGTATPLYTLHNTGSEGKAVRRINSGASHTITATDNVLHFVTGASGSVILPTAASSTGRIITISNHSVAMTTSIAYRTAAATTTTAIAVNAEISIMSGGTEWFLTNN